MKSFKQVAEEFVPKFQRATKTDVHYTGVINGKSYVVPHAFHDIHRGTKVTPIRHAIVVSPTHVQHNNPTLTPEESARVHSHIKDLHGGQEPKRLGNLDESYARKGQAQEKHKIAGEAQTYDKKTGKWDVVNKEFYMSGRSRKHALNKALTFMQKMHPSHKEHEVKILDESWLPMRGPNASKETPEVNAAHAKWEKEHTPRGVYDSDKLEEERQLALHLGMRKSDSHAPKALKPAKVSKPRPAVSKREQDPEAYQKERDVYRHAALSTSRKAATLAFAKKHHIVSEDTMLNEGRPIRGDVFSHHQTLIAKKTLRMPDAMVGVMGGQTKDEARNHLKKMGWTKKQVHDHEHAQFAEGVDVAQEVPEQINELNKDTLKSYTRKSYGDIGFQSGMVAHLTTKKYKHPWLKKSSADQLKVHTRKEKNRGEGLDRALGKLGLEENMSDEHVHYVISKAEHPKEYAAAKKKSQVVPNRQAFRDDFKRVNDAAEKKARMNWHKHGGKLFRESEQLEESFMDTYNRNQNANRHTANIVHLANHFGDTADQAQAKFYAQELKKHGHNIHHEAQYKLHEKLFPKAVVAHHMKEESEQLDELKVPKSPSFLHRVLLGGSNLRDVASRVHTMGHQELKSLHHSYEKNPPQSMVQAQQHRSIKKALRKYGDPQGTHTPVDKSKFVKKNLNEELHAYDVHHMGKHIDTIFYGHNEPVEEVKKSLINHDGYHHDITVRKQPRKLKESEKLKEKHSDTFNTVKRVLHENYL